MKHSQSRDNQFLQVRKHVSLKTQTKSDFNDVLNTDTVLVRECVWPEASSVWE